MDVAVAAEWSLETQRLWCATAVDESETLASSNYWLAANGESSIIPIAIRLPDRELFSTVIHSSGDTKTMCCSFREKYPYLNSNKIIYIRMNLFWRSMNYIARLWKTLWFGFYLYVLFNFKLFFFTSIFHSLSLWSYLPLVFSCSSICPADLPASISLSIIYSDSCT